MNRVIGPLAALAVLPLLLASSDRAAAQSLLPGVPTVVSIVTQAVPTVVRQATQVVPTVAPPTVAVAPATAAIATATAIPRVATQVVVPVATAAQDVGAPVATAVPQVVAPLATPVSEPNVQPLAPAGTTGAQPQDDPAATASSAASSIADAARTAPIVGPATGPVVDAVTGTAPTLVDPATGVVQQTTSAPDDSMQFAPDPPAIPVGASDPTADPSPSITAAAAPSGPDSEPPVGDAGQPATAPEASSTEALGTSVAVDVEVAGAVAVNSAGVPPPSPDRPGPQSSEIQVIDPALGAQAAGMEDALALAANDPASDGGAAAVPDPSQLLAAELSGIDGVDDDEAKVYGPTLNPLADGSVMLAARTGADLARLLEQCGPHPPPGTPGCDRGLGPAPQPTAQAAPPDLIETAGAQAAPEPSSPESVIQSAANAVRNLVTSGLARTGVPDLSLAVLVLAVLLLAGLGLRRLARSERRLSP